MIRAPILSRSFVWHSAASHSDPDAFRSRMKRYAADVQRALAAKVQPIDIKRKGAA